MVLPLFPAQVLAALQPVDNQRLSNMPPFSLQKTAFYTLKGGLSQCKRPPL
jgi:hypothetical protein